MTMLADIASETDPRALDKVRNFLRVLADNGAVCALQYGGQGVRFTDVGQVSRSLARLEADNLHETWNSYRANSSACCQIAAALNSDSSAMGKLSVAKSPHGCKTWTPSIAICTKPCRSTSPKRKLVTVVRVNFLAQMPHWAQS